jgi:acyl dehydratase
MARFLDDLKPGDVFTSPGSLVTAEAIVAFAREFDPQPFHTEPDAGAASFFGRHVGSGWHTAALTMRMLTEAGMEIAHGLIGAGVEDMRWPTPLLPGDTLHVRVEVLSARRSAKRPEIGIVRARVQTLRDDDSVAMEMTANLVVPVRPAAI